MHKKINRIVKMIDLLMVLACLSGCAPQPGVELADSQQIVTELQTLEYSGEALTGESAVGENSSSEATDTDGLTTATEEIYVHVCGQVQTPGVYAMPKNSRICDAVACAGGLLNTADSCAVNLAEPVTDGCQVYIPAIGEELQADSSEDEGLLNLNQAGREELMSLPGIGETKADAIIAYREAHGGFATKEELMNIPGIKEGVFEKIQEYIMVK